MSVMSGSLILERIPLIQASLFEGPEDTPQDGKSEFPILFQYSDIHQSTDEQIQPNGDLNP